MLGSLRLLLRYSTGFLFVALAGIQTQAATVPDLAKVNREISREPMYISHEPLYGLYVLGPAAKTRVWAVLDKSAVSEARYDVLYFDLNANGDLTEPGERIVANPSGSGFTIGSLTDPATRDVHTDLSLSRRSDGSVMFRMMYQGDNLVMGGFAEQVGPNCRFATTPDNAPVLWPAADGVLSFQRWIWKELSIGRAADVRVLLGHHGQGAGTFCAVRKDFLPPHVAVLATLIYTDKHGKERRALSKLRGRC